MEAIGDTDSRRESTAPAAGRGEGTVALDVITTRECVDLLRGSSIGRLGVTDRAMPMILPVNFRVFNDWIVVRTLSGGTMSEAADGTVVAFEVDRADFGEKTGWSVVVVGHASLVTEGAVFESLSRLDLPAWASDGHDGYLIIKMERVSGRRLNFAA